MADHAGLIRRRRQHGYRAVDTHGRNSGPAAESAHDLRYPVEIDGGENDGIRLFVDGGYRIGRDHDRTVGKPGEQEVAKDQGAARSRLLKIGPIAEIDTDKDVVG